MTTPYRRRAIGALTAALLAVLSGCVATVDDGPRGGYGVGYYEPYGQPYGGWPAGYHVAPPRGDRDRETHSRPEENRSRKYRPADSSRPVPSLPSKRRSSDHDHGH